MALKATVSQLSPMCHVLDCVPGMTLLLQQTQNNASLASSIGQLSLNFYYEIFDCLLKELSSVQQARIGNIKTTSFVPSLCCRWVYIRAGLPGELPTNAPNTWASAAHLQDFRPVTISSSQIEKQPSPTGKISVICLPDSGNIFIKLPLSIMSFLVLCPWLF